MWLLRAMYNYAHKKNPVSIRANRNVFSLFLFCIFFMPGGSPFLTPGGVTWTTPRWALVPSAVKIRNTLNPTSFYRGKRVSKEEADQQLAVSFDFQMIRTFLPIFYTRNFCCRMEQTSTYLPTSKIGYLLTPQMSRQDLPDSWMTRRRNWRPRKRFLSWIKVSQL